MDKELLYKYSELTKKYPNHCFKYPSKDAFILGIVTQNGIICYKVEKDIYDLFNVRILDYCFEFNSYIEGNHNSLDNLNLEEVSHFEIKENTLFYYFGNDEELIIPIDVYSIYNGAFRYNDKIRYVKGESINEISYYAFRDNKNLEKIQFPKATRIGNLLNVPNLKEVILGTNINSFYLEDPLTDFKTIIVDDESSRECTIQHNSNIPIFFLELGDYNGAIARIKGNTIGYEFKNKISDHFNEVLIFQKLYFKLPLCIRKIIEDLKYTFYLIDDLPYAGEAVSSTKVIKLDFECVTHVLYHEIGHAIDFYLNNISKTDEFKNIYNIEKNMMYSNLSTRQSYIMSNHKKHILSSSIEFFAECFSRYFNDTKSFYEECPSAYNYINDLINELNMNYQTQNNLILK